MFLNKFISENNSYQEISETLRQSCYPSVDFYVLMTLSVFIASFGLLLDSSAVIIGAMIIAPLMDPLLGISFSSLTNNRRFQAKSMFTILTGILLGLILSYLIGSSFGFLGQTQEIMARTRPTTLDLIVALASGTMGAYAKVRKTVGGSLYGVAIAISLVPPLSVVGIGLAMGNPNIYLGAGLLFLANVMSVILSGTVVFFLLGFDYFRKDLRSLIVPLVGILVLGIPLLFSFRAVIQKKLLKDEIRTILQTETYTFRRGDIQSIEVDPYGEIIEVRVTIQTTSMDISVSQLDQVQAYLQEKVNKPVHIEVNLAPVIRITGHS